MAEPPLSFFLLEMLAGSGLLAGHEADRVNEHTPTACGVRQATPHELVRVVLNGIAYRAAGICCGAGLIPLFPERVNP
jgi:hypothetical protein